jgi:hypothetical protein
MTAYRSEFSEEREIAIETRNGVIVFERVRLILDTGDSLRMKGEDEDGNHFLIAAFHDWNGWWFNEREEYTD